VIKRILMAVDGSPRAEDVARTAIAMARRWGAELVPFHAVLVPPDFPPAAHVAHGDPLPARMIREAERTLRSMTEGVTDVPVAAPVVREGAPASAIVAAAEELDVDLVVLGSHGYAGLDRLLGTTAASVVNHCRRNVLVVHERTGA
jgi:nucleotide-binding universal stress UspA family protein